MKPLLAFLILFINLVNLSAQSKEILNEDFSSPKNKNIWEAELGYLSAKIDSGKYVIYSQDDKNYNLFRPYITASLDSGQAFSISIDCSFTSQFYTRKFAGLTFCSNQFSEYQFLCTTTGEWALIEKTKGKLNPIKGGPSRAIKQGMGAVNILKISSKDNEWEFFINDTSVYKTKALRYYGNCFGVVFSEYQKISFDNFIIKGSPLNTKKGNFCSVFPSIYKNAISRFGYLLGSHIKGNTLNNRTYKSIIWPEQDSLSTIEINQLSAIYTSNLNTFKTIEPAKKYLAGLATQLKKCNTGAYYIDNDNPEKLTVKFFSYIIDVSASCVIEIKKRQNDPGFDVVLTFMAPR